MKLLNHSIKTTEWLLFDHKSRRLMRKCHLEKDEFHWEEYKAHPRVGRMMWIGLRKDEYSDLEKAYQRNKKIGKLIHKSSDG